MQRLTLPAPAKLNLFLHITGRRGDGYHTLQTLFQLLDYGDTLHFTPRTDGLITLHPTLAGVELTDNLIYRAALLLKQQCSCPLGVDIELEKRLPRGGGIGGGSSDAATALLGLNQIWQLGLNLDQLAELGRQLGADVPVFVRGQTAWAEGIGEILQPVEMPEKWFVVLAPNCHVSTADIFSHKDLTRDHSNITVAAFLEQGGINDCQKLVQKLYPEVDKALGWLAEFAPSKMTGTGACVFAAFDQQTQAEAVFQQKPNNLQGFVAKGVNHSRVHKTLGL